MMDELSSGGAVKSLPVAPQPGAEHEDWRWQLRRAVHSAHSLSEHLTLSDSERVGVERAERNGFPLGITPYYLGLIDRTDPSCPIRRQVVPLADEAQEVMGDLRDPLGEEAYSPAPELVQRYPDRALLLVTDQCAVYCRFCTRSRIVGSGVGPRPELRLKPALDYIRGNSEIRDVILSGGDLLTMSTSRIVKVIAAVRDIPHVETIRLATRVPVVLPMRIDDELLSSLRPFHPLWVMTHFNHPKELTSEAKRGLNRLADAGFPVMNQSVLLRGVNDSAETLEALFRGLVRERVRPYYLLQADPVRGTGHLRTSLQTGLDIMQRLQGRLSGIALPKYIVDAPGGHGKVPVLPNWVLNSRPATQTEPGRTRLLTWRGVEVDYIDPPGSSS